MKNLKGKIALITGGNSGIGYAAVKQLKTANKAASFIHRFGVFSRWRPVHLVEMSKN